MIWGTAGNIFLLCLLFSNFRFVLSPIPTPATLLYLKKRCQWASAVEVAKLDHIEVCPKAMELTHQITKRISSDGGGALIIDYGENGIISDSLQVSIFFDDVDNVCIFSLYSQSFLVYLTFS